MTMEDSDLTIPPAIASVTNETIMEVSLNEETSAKKKYGEEICGQKRALSEIELSSMHL